MKKLFFILITIICFYSFASFAQSCSLANKKPTIDFYASYGKLHYDFSKNQNEITQIAQSYGIIERGLFASGLAVLSVNWEISVNTISEIITDYDICVVPTNIDVFIGYKDPTIYISNQLKAHSCEYNVVLRHEQTHQQINKTALEHFIPYLKNIISQTIEETPIIRVKNIHEIDAATNELTKNYNKKIAPVVESFKNELLKEQSKLDSHENYQFEAKFCTKKKQKN